MKFKHDFHIHTFYSSDAAENVTVENYVNEAKRLGLKKIGFAEHFWDDKIDGAFPFYKSQTFEYVSNVKTEIEKYTCEDIKLYFGCEVEYNPKAGAPALSEEIAQKFDYIIVPNSHSHETMPKEYYNNKQKHLDFLINAYENIINCNLSKYITAIAHPFSLVRCPYPCNDLIAMVSDDTFKRMFYNTAEKEIAIEINASSVMSSIIKDGVIDESSPLLKMFALSKKMGCKFIFGSDSHYIEYLENIRFSDMAAEYLEIKENDIVV